MTTMPNYKTHTNKENTVACPYCGEHYKSRGLYQHVWRSSNEEHGGHKNVPEDWDSIEPEVVGSQSVSMHVPTNKEYDHQKSTCKFCGKTFQGTHGLSVHLSRVDDTVHPDNVNVESAGIRNPNEFSDKDTLSASNETGENAGKTDDVPAGYVPVADVAQLIAQLEGRGNEEAADAIRETIQPYR